MKKILFTGGGSAGHVTANAALIPAFKKLGWEIHYMGSLNGIEADLIRPLKDVRYSGIATGKLRRYFALKNFTDPFRVMKGCYEAYRLIKQIKPDVVFSKGGFVSVPVVLGAWLNKVPVIIHESDITPGLANRIAIPFAAKVCATFPETMEHLPSSKAQLVGAVVRQELRNGDAAKGLALCGFTSRQPVLLVMGGSLGSQRINRMIRDHLSELTETLQIVHICGAGQIDRSLISQKYRQFEYVTDTLPDIMAMADIVVSRAGSNAIFEFLALQKPMLLIPLSRQASRGDQILNAQSFEKRGFCELLLEEEMNSAAFLDAVRRLYDNRLTIVENMKQHQEEDTIGHVVRLITDTAR